MKVYLVATPKFEIDQVLTFLRERSDTDSACDGDNEWRRSANATQAEELVEAAGRICYMSFGSRQSGRTNDVYIRRLIEMGHESVLEHVAWTFLIADVSRALTHQLVRHRVGFAFSQLSQQYHEESDADFVEPPILKQLPDAHKAWCHAVGVAKEAYRQILQELSRTDLNSLPELDNKEVNRAARSAARSVLPNAAATTIMVTVNGRALRHFLAVRGSIPGDEEMRRLAAELFKKVKEQAPAIVSDFKLDVFSDGSPVVTKVAL